MKRRRNSCEKAGVPSNWVSVPMPALHYDLDLSVFPLSVDIGGRSATKRRKSFIRRLAYPASQSPDEAGFSSPKWSKVGGKFTRFIRQSSRHQFRPSSRRDSYWSQCLFFHRFPIRRHAIYTPFADVGSPPRGGTKRLYSMYSCAKLLNSSSDLQYVSALPLL